MSAQHTPGPLPLTEDEQAILVQDVAALRLLALWNHIRSGRVDSVKEAQYHEERSGQLYEAAYALGARRPKGGAA